MSDANLREAHERHAWMPFTQMKLLKDPPVLKRGQGVYLYDENDKPIIDAIGSWWVNIHGHCNPSLLKAIHDQFETLEHSIYAGLAHAPATRLAERLSESTGHRLPRVYYSDNGSTAMEIACKMAFQYFANRGEEKRRRFVVLSGGYHGDTFGTMAIGARGVFHEIYQHFLFDVLTIDPPRMAFADFDSTETQANCVEPALADARAVFEKYHGEICGLVLEPLIQGASAGMSFYPASFLKGLRQLCNEFGVLLVADEVFTGCGRTGKMYACEHAGIWPDIMALAKGLSGGYMPIAATLATEDVFQAFYSNDRRRTLFHGHSMTGHPPGCAASLASLDLLKAGNLERARRLGEIYARLLPELGARLEEAVEVREHRYLGSVGVIELGGGADYTSEFGWNVMRGSIERGALIRPLGRSIYFTPPFIIEESELDRVGDALVQTVFHVVSQVN